MALIFVNLFIRKIDDHSQSHWVSTEFVNVTEVYQFDELCVLIPSLCLFLSGQKVRDMLFFLYKDCMGFGNVEIGLVGGFVLFAESFDVGVFFLCYFSDVFLSYNRQCYV